MREPQATAASQCMQGTMQSPLPRRSCLERRAAEVFQVRVRDSWGTMSLPVSERLKLLLSGHFAPLCSLP